MKKLVIAIAVLALSALFVPLTPAAQSPDATSSIECEEEYVVQDSDWLSKIAEKSLNDPLAYPALLVLSNAVPDDKYANIENPDVIEPGWTLCIPGDEDLPKLLSEAGPVMRAAARFAGIELPAPLQNTLWVLVASGDVQNPTVVEPGVVTTAQFLEDGTLTGSGGCNNYNAGYEISDDGEMSIGPAASTRKACPTGMAQEDAFLAALSEAESYEIMLSGLLKITIKSGLFSEEALFFAPGQADLQNTQWVLHSYGNPEDLQAVEAGTTITAVFTGQPETNSGTVVGFSGCNSYSADYAVEEGQMDIAPPISTRMACAAGGEQELLFLSLLGGTETFQIAGRYLQMSGPDGILNFTSANLPLENVLWTLESYGPPGLQQPVSANLEITALFVAGEESNTGRVSGSAGCNSYNATYEREFNQLTFGPALTTLMACPVGMDAEQAFLGSLQTAGRFQVLGDQLRLFANEGESVLTFRANRASLEGTYWALTSYGDIENPQLPFEGTQFSAVFDGAHDSPSGIVAGGTGCNSYSATYAASLTRIKTNLPTTTQAFCGDGVAEMEQAYFLGLNNAGQYHIVGNALQVVYDEGRQALNFVASQPPSPAVPPTAVISGPTQAQAGVTVTFNGSASQSESAIVQYNWDFGDGTTAVGETVSHSYSRAGAYSVRLTVVDDRGLSSTATSPIAVNNTPQPQGPTAVIEGPGEAVVGEEVTFQGGNSIPGSSPIVVYSWDFGNTRAMADRPDVSATTVYDAPGVYNVTLTVRDQNDLSDSASMQITIIEKDEPVELPTAVINAPGETEVSVPARLDGSASQPGNGGNIVSYEWQLGDGNTANGPVVEHVYNNPGGFEIVLIVTDESGNSNNTLQGILVTETEPPTPEPTPTPEPEPTAPPEPDGPPFEGTVWVLNGSLPDTTITAQFVNGTVSGSSGCNSYSGPYTSTKMAGDSNNISIGPLAGTQKMCGDEVMAQEQTYLAALSSAQSYTIEGNTMVMGPLVFTAQ